MALLPRPLAEYARAVYLGRVWLQRETDVSEPDLTVVRALLREGETAIDGGANFGRYADALAEAVGPRGSVIAIEPVPRTALLLRRVLRYRARLQVTVMQVALGATGGTVRMEIPQSPAGESNFFRAHVAPSATGRDSFEVELATLDDIAGQLPHPPSLVKLDLEGYERTALEGASDLLDAGAAWIVEMNDDPDDPSSDSHAIESEFATRGYRAWIWHEGVLRPRAPGPRGPNVFLLLPKHLDRVTRAGIEVES